MMFYNFGIMCGTEGCTNFGKEVNEIDLYGTEDEVEAFWEGFGHGSEEEEDYCKVCKQLGVLLE